MHEIATQLRIYDIAFAIDDFGEGFSSFARLRELPFAELKLDRSFVKDSGTDRKNAGICQTIIDLAPARSPKAWKTPTTCRRCIGWAAISDRLLAGAPDAEGELPHAAAPAHAGESLLKCPPYGQFAK
jgi:hypothetical protein